MDALIKQLFESLPHWGSFIYPAALILGVALLGLIVSSVAFKLARRLSAGKETKLNNLLIRHTRGPARLLIPLLTIRFFLTLIRMPERPMEFVNQALAILMILAVAWMLIRILHVVQDVVLNQHATDVADNLRARRIHTQISMLRKVLISIIGVLAFASILMTFPQIRQLGTSILASAGIVGIIVGFAAQRSIATLIAGLQIAFTQPIRLDDVVIVENEWGWVEEITLTYVVVRIWDLRRLILPITYFLEHPFQNWTRATARILGSVFIHTDYRMPVDEIRRELTRIASESAYWDGDVCNIQVTNASENTMELRALVSASNSGNAWNLRCHIREELIRFLQEKHPEGLPRFRVELKSR